MLVICFLCCSSLTYLPVISKWKIDNIINVNSIFIGCSSLLILPDISKMKIKDKSKISDILSLSSDYSSSKKYNLIKSNKISSLKTEMNNKNSSSVNKEITNFNSSFEDNNIKFGNNYNDFNFYEKEDKEKLDEYYENFYK